MFFIREYFIKDPSICDLLFDVTKGLKEKGYGQPGTAWSPDAPEDYDMTEAKDSWDILPAIQRDHHLLVWINLQMN